MSSDHPYFFCQTGFNQGHPHKWSYPKRQLYRCDNCLVEFSKAALKEHTDA